MNTNMHFWTYVAPFFIWWELFQTYAVENIKIRILCSVLFFDSRAVCENVEK